MDSSTRPMSLALVALTTFFAPVTSQEAAPGKQARTPVLRRLGINGTLAIAKIKTPLRLTPEEGPGLLGNILPGQPSRGDLLPAGWMIWVERDSPLYQGGFRTGDVITAIGAKQHLQPDEDVSCLLEAALAKGSAVPVRIRHFNQSFWKQRIERAKGGAPTPPAPTRGKDLDPNSLYRDREVVLLPLR